MGTSRPDPAILGQEYVSFRSRLAFPPPRLLSECCLLDGLVHDEMWRVELAMQRILGRSPAFMGPPYGNYNDRVREASGVRNQSIVNLDFEYVPLFLLF